MWRPRHGSWIHDLGESSQPEISTDGPIAVIWGIFLSVYVQFFLILITQMTMSIFNTLFCLSYVPLVAFVVTHFFSPVTGMGGHHAS
jgi:hypothetical protein